MIEEKKRLHISPLTPDLLPIILGTIILPIATNISYHSLETFPENNYGFVDLPSMEAERVKKKMNGTILKGRKVKVEEARVEKKRKRGDDEEGEDANGQRAKQAKKDGEVTKKKERKERTVLEGRELSPDRTVKRGWTEAKSAELKAKSRKDGKEKRSSKKDKKDKSTIQQPSKYTTNPELLFRTKIPANKSDIVPPSKKDKEKKAKSKKNRDEKIVHEFERTTKQPSFLKQDVGLGISTNLEYVEGRGWVDTAGEVVEAESERVTRKREATKVKTKRNPQTTTKPLIAESPGEEQPSVHPEPDIEGFAVDDGSDGSSDSNSASEATTPSSTPAPTTEQPTTSTEIHPLEALFKKPSKPASESQDVPKPSLEISTTFSFLNPDADDLEDEDSDAPVVPLTPYSSQEWRSRGLRSAAPTPDTAHPSRFNSYGSSGLSGDEPSQNEDEDEDGDETQTFANTRSNAGSKSRESSATGGNGVSDFEKKFWENRAENNRAWKLRRRTVLKEKRKRENKARRPKNW
jgi:hypothetical protein